MNKYTSVLFFVLILISISACQASIERFNVTNDAYVDSNAPFRDTTYNTNMLYIGGDRYYPVIDLGVVS